MLDSQFFFRFAVPVLFLAGCESGDIEAVEDPSAELSADIAAERLQSNMDRCSIATSAAARDDCFAQQDAKDTDALVLHAESETSGDIIAGPIEGSGKWRTGMSRNANDTADVFGVALVAESARPEIDSPYRLSATCTEGMATVILTLGRFVGDDSPGARRRWKLVETRLDDHSTREGRWPVSSTRESVKWPGEGGETLGALAAAETLQIDMSDGDGRALTARFDLRGLNHAIGDYAGFCGLPEPL
ncbi:MAG: hypothetical protein WA979_03135 [Pacificimonas sp.]